MDTTVNLISETFSKNEYGEEIATKTSRQIFATLQSVGRSEWFKAAQNDLQSSFVVITPAVNYDAEKIVEIDGEEYAVYRTFLQNDSDLIEIYCEQKAGVSNG